MDIKRFKWVQRQSMWKSMEASRQARARMTQRFLDDSAFASSAIANAHTGLSSGLASIAAQVSIERTQREIALKAAQLDKLV